MAASEILRIGKQYYAPILAVRDSLDSKYRTALFSSEGASSPAWGLTLVLASWKQQKLGNSLADVAETGVVPLVAQVSQFEGAFPASFAKFLRTSEEARDVGGIAAAGSYFSATISGLGILASQGLLGWLSSAGFLRVAKALSAKLGGPDAVPKVLPPSRTVRGFDQADYQPRIAAPVAQEAPKQVTAARPSAREEQLAMLIAAGWSREQAERILAGPSAQGKVTGDTILDRANGGGKSQTSSKTEEAGGIPGAVKSGIDLLRELIKLGTSSSGSGNSGGGGSKQGGGIDLGGGRGGGGLDTGGDEGGSNPTPPETMGGGGYTDVPGDSGLPSMADDFPIFDEGMYDVNTSAEVID